MYKVAFYVPKSHLEIVKEAMFAVGAGRYKGYSRCAWQIMGQGQFYPEAESSPSIGEKEVLVTVHEYYVSMVCDRKIIDDVMTAMRQAHPYEQVAYEILALVES